MTWQEFTVDQEIGPKILFETQQKMNNRKIEEILFLLKMEFCARKKWSIGTTQTILRLSDSPLAKIATWYNSWRILDPD